MSIKHWLPSLSAFVFMGVSMLAFAGVPVGPVVQLEADFNNRTPGEVLGAGGAALGEPADLSGLDGEIVESSPGENFLLVTNDLSNTNGRSLRWGLVDNAEITSGVARFAFDFTPAGLERYSLGVRESGGSAFTFLSLAFLTGGTIVASDAAGTISLSSNTYSANVTMHVVMSFDMDAGTSELTVNGNTLFSGRAHGIVGRGVGRLLTGYNSSNTGQSFRLDNIRVTATLPLPLVLNADFDTQTVGQPIGTGGAALGEPHSASSGTTTQIVDVGMGNRILQLNASTGSAQNLRWEFLDNIEVTSGIVAFDFDVLFGVLDQYQILIREAGGSASAFATLRFFSSGAVSLADAGGSAGVSGVSYAANQRYRVRLIFDMDSATYTAMLGNTVLVEDRPHSVVTGRGIGAITTGFQSSAQFGGPIFIDALQVGVSDARNIPGQIGFLVQPTSGFANLPLSPAVEVGVVNVFDQPVGDGVMVGLEILSGPAGAVLSGAVAPTVAGIARFNGLRVDRPGTYRLSALAGNVVEDSTVNIVVTADTDTLFRNGFDDLTR